MVSISDLNDDCLIQILNNLPVYDLLILLLTSTRFNEAAKFVFPKLCFRLTDVRQLYEIYSVLEANDIVQQSVRKLSINLKTESSDLVLFINSINNKLQELTITDGDFDFGDRYGIIELCQNIRSLNLVNVKMADSFMKKIILKNNGQLTELSINNCDFQGEPTFLKDVRNLEKITFLSNNREEHISINEFLENNCDSLNHVEICTKSPILNGIVVSKFHKLRSIYIGNSENDIDILPLAKIPTLKRIRVDFNNNAYLEIANTFYDDLAKTGSVEKLCIFRSYFYEKVGPSIKMNSLKCLRLYEVCNFRFKNVPELEELWISSLNLEITDNYIRNILQILPKLKALNLILISLTENICIALEQFLAEQNRKLIFSVSTDAFNKVMDNPDDFKYLRLKIMDCWSTGRDREILLDDVSRH